MVDRPHHEIELKLRVPQARSTEVAKAVEGRRHAPRIHLQASYLDTPAFDLARSGIGWRLRHEGRRWVQTVKANVADGGDGMRRLEHNVALGSRARPVPDAARHADHPAGDRLITVIDALKDQPAEQFLTDVWRIARTVTVAGGRVELAFDKGQIVADGRTAPLCELEIELVRGAPQVVIDTAREWVAHHGLWLDSTTKAQRGVMLAKGLTQAPIAKAPVPALHPEMSVDGALREMTRACLVQILGNASAIAGGLGGSEHVHQTRVGIRKLRTALREFGAFSSAVRPDWSERLAEIFGHLGAARDREIVLEGWRRTLDHVDAPEIPAPPATTTDPGELLRDPMVTQLMLDLLEYVHGTPDPADPDHLLRDVVGERLEVLRRHGTGHGNRFASMPVEDQHDVRKELKRLRYIAELTEALYSAKKVQRYVRALEPTQDALGALNDLVVATDFFREMTSAQPSAWFAVGWLSARRDHTVLACAGPLRAARAAKPYW